MNGFTEILDNIKTPYNMNSFQNYKETRHSLPLKKKKKKKKKKITKCIIHVKVKP